MMSAPASNPPEAQNASEARWLIGREPAALENAASAFGLSLEALLMLSAIKALGATLDQQEAAAWASVGLTSAQGWVLTELALVGSCPQHVVAERLLVTPSSVSQVIARLEVDNLVVRVRDATDGRVRRLTVSKEGERLVRIVVPQVRRLLANAEAALGPEGITAFLSHLTVLGHALDDNSGPATDPKPSAGSVNGD